MVLELHKGSFTIIGRRSNLIKTIILVLTQRKFLMINYNVTHLFFTFNFIFATTSFYYKIWSKINISLIFSSCANSSTLDIISAVFGSSSINGKKILPLC